MNNKDITKTVERCKKIHGDSLIAILQRIQEEYRYIPEDAIKIVSKKLALPLIDVYGVATFYSAFKGIEREISFVRALSILFIPVL